MFNPKDYVNYAHKDAPKGPRFVGMANEPVPEWAVDIKVGDPGLNKLGLFHHVSDQYVDFTAAPLDHPQDPKEIIKVMRFRQLWGRFHSDKEALEFIEMLK